MRADLLFNPVVPRLQTRELPMHALPSEHTVSRLLLCRHAWRRVLLTVLAPTQQVFSVHLTGLFNELRTLYLHLMTFCCTPRFTLNETLNYTQLNFLTLSIDRRNDTILTSQNIFALPEAARSCTRLCLKCVRDNLVCSLQRMTIGNPVCVAITGMIIPEA
ncbi:hypothetical protein BS47DRAFT_1486986 [Hydnum rufescens UP504]|uniref:Uncharacterized protein n=1 Tax=Hydnum rufescens UP504 TaxID=1448309 RepID=A0A9P6DV25_9AGAM|nr:hypothetical protein BS47DRAFT_1486986 [Hydnum rufescens UP504]